MHGWKFYLLIAVTVLSVFSTTLSLLTAHEDVHRIDARLRAGKVCTEMNQRACQALFDRLSNNITDAQRKRLACAVFHAAGVKPNINCPEG